MSSQIQNTFSNGSYFTSATSTVTSQHVSENPLADPFFIYNNAFQKPKILDLIMEYAAHDRDKDLALKTIKSFRRVQKHWLARITNVLRGNKMCIYCLTLSEEHSLQSSAYVQVHGKWLDQFVSCMEKCIEGNAPTFQLILMEDYFREENYDSLINCFKKCGQSLLGLDLKLPVTGMSFPGVFSNEPLTALETLSVTFSDYELTRLSNSEIITVTNVSLMLSSLLLGNKKTLHLTFDTHYRDLLPNAFEYFVLPPTISRLELKSFHTPEMLALLSRNALPCLKKLQLYVSNHYKIDGEVLFAVLDKLTETLRTFILIAEAYHGVTRNQNLMEFPLMKELRTLYFGSIDIQLKKSPTPSLPNLLPKIKSLTVEVTVEMLQLWTSSPMPTVTHLCISLVRNDVDDEHPDYFLPVNVETMQAINITFPNIWLLVLNLNISEKDSSGLKYLFQEMKQLTSLTLHFYGTKNIKNSKFFDSLFIGAPQKLAAALKGSPSYWKNMKIKNDLPSIRMLNCLKSLTLASDDKYSSVPLISDLVAEFAFLKMPELNQLFLKDRFTISKRMAKKWINTGRNLEMM